MPYIETLRSVALSIPPSLATAAQGIGKRAWEAELLRRLQARLWTVRHRPNLGLHVHSRQGDSRRSGIITALLTGPPPTDPDSPPSPILALHIERTSVTARTRHKLSSALQARVAHAAAVIVLYQPNPQASQPPSTNFPEGHVIMVGLPFPIDWSDEVLTHSRNQSRIRLGPGYRGVGGARPPPSAATKFGK